MGRSRQPRADAELPDAAGVILPSQFCQLAGRRQFSNEQRLMLAVLADAIYILAAWRPGGSATGRQRYLEAVQWVRRPGGRSVFSFDNVCDALEIEAGALRRRLAELRKNQLPSAARLNSRRLRLKDAGRAHLM